VVIAILAALGAGGGFAAGGVLQQRVAGTRPERDALSFRLLVDLAHEPQWLLGIGVALVAYVLEALALSFGPLVLVQPLIVSELLFALPISVRWRGMKMGSREWLGSSAIAAGLAVGLASAAPRAGRAGAPVAEWIVALGAAGGLTALVVASGRRTRGPARSSLYAIGAGIVIGTQASLLKATIPPFEHGVFSALESWELWATLVTAVLGLLLLQSAYESGPLAMAMPALDAIEPAIAIVLGMLLFHESIRTGIALIGVGAGVAALLLGVILLDTSPVIRCLQKAQRTHQGAADCWPEFRAK
jgi:drug/metabolite transporter (DMT)-like permease